MQHKSRGRFVAEDGVAVALMVAFWPVVLALLCFPWLRSKFLAEE